jgi:hypothetical protein
MATQLNTTKLLSSAFSEDSLQCLLQEQNYIQHTAMSQLVACTDTPQEYFAYVGNWESQGALLKPV